MSFHFKPRVVLRLSSSFPSKPPLRSLTRLRKSWAALCSSGEPICPSQTEGGNAANYGLQMWETTVNTLLSRAKHDFVISSDLHIFQVLQNGIPRVRAFSDRVSNAHLSSPVITLTSPFWLAKRFVRADHQLLARRNGEVQRNMSWNINRHNWDAS